jgi:hypothetical protein
MERVFATVGAIFDVNQPIAIANAVVIECKIGGAMTPDEYTRATSEKFGCEWSDELPIFESAIVGDLVGHWFELFNNSDGNLPFKSEIDPVIIRGALSRVFMYERLDTDFVCRLAGERIAWNYEERLKGRRLSEIFTPPIHEMVSLLMRACLDVTAIYRNFGLLYGDGRKRAILGERVYLPLRHDDGRAMFLIGLTDVETVANPPRNAQRTLWRCQRAI